MPSRRRHVVAFAIPGQGHVNRLLPVVAGLCELGVSVDFFADVGARASIERTGARFVDLFAQRSMDVPDGTSLPVPMRNVSFAAYWGADVVREIAPLRPDVILHDTFAVIGRVAAFHLKLPRINMRAGHNVEPNRARAALEAGSRLTISEVCYRHVEILRQEHGIADASPFSYFIDDAADLHICSEPPEFLPPQDRYRYQPVEFFGSYWVAGDSASAPADEPFGADADTALRVYVALGTTAWKVSPEFTLALLDVFADAMASFPNLRGIISLGEEHVPAGITERLRRPNVRVERYVDQIAALRRASAFITHNGLNSTHEAVFHRVPMISYPLFGDQPVMAARCQELGLAVSMVPVLGQVPTVADVHRALERIQTERAALHRQLTQARQWELAVMERRPAVLQRILDLMDGT